MRWILDIHKTIVKAFRYGNSSTLFRAIGEATGKASTHPGGDEVCPKQALQFLYAFGATLNVVKPAKVLLSTGSVAFPLNRPVCAVCEIEVDPIFHCYLLCLDFIYKDRNQLLYIFNCMKSLKSTHWMFLYFYFSV